jgi:uncharacterized repeat protein (TIGR03803 family)
MRHRRILAFLTLNAIACQGLSAQAGPPNLTLNVLYSFANGESPNASVVVGTNGSFHGTTATGGPNNFGGVYEVTANGVLTNEFWLDGTNGSTPMAPLIQGKGGNFYGTASRGGVSNNGTIFRVTSAGIQLVASFGNTNGATPLAPLLEGTNGWFYGTTFNGGSSDLGSIFAINDAGVLTNVYSFGGSDGANPAAGLIEGTDGNLYGTTEYGGADDFGTVFQLTYAGLVTNLCSFTIQTGKFPGGLIEDAKGNLYGATINGGFDSVGTIFKVITSNTLQTIVVSNIPQTFFTSNALQTLFSFGITNGANPDSPLTAGNDGNWYGTTEDGGASGLGTVFYFNTNGFLADLISFDGTNGALPRSGVVQGTDGNFYGTTSQGGAYGYGEIYQLTGFPPFIIKPPATQKWASNATSQFSVTAGGSAPLSYQWLFDGTNTLPGATNATLVINHEQLTNSGTYTVIVSNPYGEFSNNALLSVVAPTVTIVSPPATVTNASLAISGAAAGPNGVAIVLCQLNGNGWSAASGTTHWQTNLTLQPGTNTFQAQSFDPVGNPSAIKTIAIFYTTVSPLTLQTNGLGSISASFKGTNLTVDRSYTVRAIPDKGQLFLSWSGSVSTTKNPLTFVMQSNLVVRANFVTNPFIAAAGTYEGLFSGDDGVAEQSAGLVRSLVIGTSGAYSGQVVIKGVAHGFTGSFDASEQSNPTVARPGDQGGPLALNMTLSANEVTGTVSGTDSGGWTSALRAEQAVKSGSAQYTLLVPPGPGAPSNCPPGYGYALVTNHNGLVTLNGATADGAAFSQTAPIVGAGDLPFYASLYGNTGLLFGWLNFNGGLTGTNLWWIKTASSSSALYPGGFTNVFTVLASAWTEAPADFLPSGTLTISNTSLALDFVVSIANYTLIKEPGSPSNSLTGVINPKTGLLKITFGNGTRKATTAGYAAILQDSTQGGGYFLTTTNAGAVLLQP